ncbi:hypothetical protein PFISCL1PPCAC_22139, partial [Pristionchus fissidentatus]
VGLDDEGVVEAAMNGKGELRLRAKHLKSDYVAQCEYTCSDFITTPDCSYLLIGCKDGEVLQLQPADMPVDAATGFKEIMQERTAIDQISIFKEAAVAISESQEMLFAVLTGGVVCVFALSLDGSFDCLAECATGMDTILGLGSLQRVHHAVWMFSKKSVKVWRGEEGTFEKEDDMENLQLQLDGDFAAVAAATASSAAAVAAHLDVVCVGTTEGEIGCVVSDHAGSDVSISARWGQLMGVEGRVIALAADVFEDLKIVSGAREFGLPSDFRLQTSDCASAS